MHEAFGTAIIIDALSRETAGEEDHSTYNLGVLKKPVYAITDEEILANGGRIGMQNMGKYNRSR